MKMANVKKDNKDFKKKRKQFKRKDAEAKFSAKDRDMDANPRTNDPSWYTVTPELLRDAGSYSFNNPLGNTLRITELSNVDSSINYNQFDRLDRTIPGIMVMRYIPTAGYSANHTSVVNTAAKALYSAVRGDNSGAKNYEPADLMKYLLALDSAYSMYAFMARIYGLSRVYSVVNRYWPKAIIESLNVDFADVMANSADLRYAINIYAAKLNTFCAPAIMKIFDRHFMMTSGVWKDRDMDKSQMYVFTPDYLYQYDEETVPARLAPLALAANSTKFNVKSLIEMANTMLNALSNSEDIGIISGDLFKRYGMQGSHKLAQVPYEFAVYPTYDEVVLNQIHNARFVGYIDPVTIPIIELTADPDKGSLYQVLGGTNTASIMPGLEVAHPLDVTAELDQITPELVMEASRLTTLGKNIWNTSDGCTYQITTCGSEVCTYFAIVYLRSDNGEPTTAYSTATTFSSSLPALNNQLSVFNLHPMHVNYTDALQNNVTWGNDGFNYDFNNYTIIGASGLDKLHENALLGMFAVPYFGQYQ